jgi:hypothetical protein
MFVIGNKYDTLSVEIPLFSVYESPFLKALQGRKMMSQTKTLLSLA